MSRLLNARPENAKKEAQIISNTGTLGNITISTNMAGRGTDIVLGGDLTLMLKLHIRSTLKAMREFIKHGNLKIETISSYSDNDFLNGIVNATIY